MSGELDEQSHLLGKLEATQTVILSGIKDINEKLTLMNGSIGKAHNRIDAVENTANDWQTTKKRGVLALLGLGMAGGAGSTGIFKALSVFIGGNG